jgi:hypothetical protein
VITAERTPPRTRALGPVAVSRRNPRYFTIAGAPDERATYLAGSHLWNNLHHGMGPGEPCSDEPERMDFSQYLDFLEERGHNFIRLWRWEQFSLVLVEWFGVDGRETIEAKDITVDVQGPVDFQSPPDTEPSVLYLRSA